MPHFLNPDDWVVQNSGDMIANLVTSLKKTKSSDKRICKH